VMSWIGIVCGAITLVVCVIYVVAFVALSNDNTY
jgi:succinate dehydrogenase hydrophobic anchor subunit